MGSPTAWCAHVVVLLEEGLDVGVADNDGVTPAHMAASNGHPECAALLKEWGY